VHKVVVKDKARYESGQTDCGNENHCPCQHLTRTRSATAGEGERGLQWAVFHKMKRHRTPASGWLHRRVRRLVWHREESLASASPKHDKHGVMCRDTNRREQNQVLEESFERPIQHARRTV